MRSRRRRPLRPWAPLLALLLPLAGSAADWPHWRGEQRTGVTSEPSGWANGQWAVKTPAWSASVGRGSTSPLVVGDRLYTLGWHGGQDRLVCLNAATGEKLWEQGYPAPEYGRHAVGDQFFYSGVSATPEYDPQTGFLYTLGVDGALHCWNTRENGKAVWKLNLYDTYGVPQRPQITRRGDSRRDYGYTAAPLVHGDWLIVEVGDDEGTLMAFDKRTGTRRWTSESKVPAGHAAGLAPMTVEGVPCVAVLTLEGLLVARLDSANAGKTVATHPWATDYANNIPTPAVQGNSVLITSNYNHRKIARFDVSLSGLRKAWEQPYPSGVCSPVIYKDRVYLASRGLHCLDWATGELKWDGGKFGDVASIIATGDDRLIVWANEGDLALVESAVRSPDQYTELVFLPKLFATEVWPHVVLANSRLYCKDRAGNLKCFRTSH
ncbi:MAG: PQQ-binding-like beta-propeller repeat protein [Armatimonadota bacterium]